MKCSNLLWKQPLRMIVINQFGGQNPRKSTNAKLVRDGKLLQPSEKNLVTVSNVYRVFTLRYWKKKSIDPVFCFVCGRKHLPFKLKFVNKTFKAEALYLLTSDLFVKWVTFAKSLGQVNPSGCRVQVQNGVIKPCFVFWLRIEAMFPSVSSSFFGIR